MTTRERVYQAIVSHIDQHGMSPSLLELQRATGVSSKSQIVHHLRVLEKDGRIIRHPWMARGIEVPGAAKTSTARAGAMIAERMFAQSEPSRECIGDVLVPGSLMDQLKRWAERVGA